VWLAGGGPPLRRTSLDGNPEALVVRRDRLAVTVIAAPLVWFAGFRWLHSTGVYFNWSTQAVASQSWYTPALAVWTICLLVAAALFAFGRPKTP
jgi:hypothetical protein